MKEEVNPLPFFPSLHGIDAHEINTDQVDVIFLKKICITRRDFLIQLDTIISIV
jgi:hypothetical protein